MSLILFLAILVLPVALARTRIQSVVAIILLAAINLFMVYVVPDFIGEAHEEFDPFEMLLGYYLLSNRLGIFIVTSIISFFLFWFTRRICKTNA